MNIFIRLDVFGVGLEQVHKFSMVIKAHFRRELFFTDFTFIGLGPLMYHAFMFIKIWFWGKTFLTKVALVSLNLPMLCYFVLFQVLQPMKVTLAQVAFVRFDARMKISMMLSKPRFACEWQATLFALANPSLFGMTFSTTFENVFPKGVLGNMWFFAHFTHIKSIMVVLIDWTDWNWRAPLGRDLSVAWHFGESPGTTPNSFVLDDIMSLKEVHKVVLVNNHISAHPAFDEMSHFPLKRSNSGAKVKSSPVRTEQLFWFFWFFLFLRDRNLHKCYSHATSSWSPLFNRSLKTLGSREWDLGISWVRSAHLKREIWASQEWDLGISRVRSGHLTSELLASHEWDPGISRVRSGHLTSEISAYRLRSHIVQG